MSDGESSFSEDASLAVVLSDYGDTRAVANALPDGTLTDPTMQALRAIALASDGDSAAARAALDALPKSRSSVLGQVAQAIVLRNEGALEAARDEIDVALMLGATNAYVHNIDGTIAAARQDWDRVVDSFGTAARLSPDGALYFANLGTAQRVLGDFGNATQSLTRALELNPQTCTAAIGRADLFALQNNIAAARNDLEQCLSTANPMPQAV